MNYKNENGAISIISLDKKTGEVSEKEITNFSAQIVKEKIVTDGEGFVRHYEIEGYFKGSTLKKPRALPKISVAASRFSDVKGWTSEEWGIDTLVHVGHNNQEHAEFAIRDSSISSPTTTYEHLGWTTIDNQPVYLHAGGGIDSSGTVTDLDIQVPGSLQAYVLPDPPTTLEEEATGIKQLLSLLDLSARRITWPMLLYVLSAPLGRNDYSVFIFGETGVGKSILAKVFLSMHGCLQDYAGFGWHSTVNALELASFTAKDSLILIDDFVSADKYSQQEMNNKAERLFRNQANGTGRSRMTASGGLQETKAPRGSILATGEEIPSNKSIRARLVILEMRKEDTDLSKLADAQKSVGNNVYSKAFAGWIKHLANQLVDFKSRLKEGVASNRAIFVANHNRISEQLAHFRTVWNLFSEYAQDKGAITRAEADLLADDLLKTFSTIGMLQESFQKEVDPIERFMELLGDALQSGRCYLEDQDRSSLLGNSNPFTRVSSSSKLIGYVPKKRTGNEIYLIPDETYNVIGKFAGDNGDFLPGQATLWKRLADKGIIKKSKDSDSKRHTHKVQIGETRPRVLIVNAAFIPGFTESASTSIQTDADQMEHDVLTSERAN